MTTTFILDPDDYSAITFNVVTPEGAEGGYTQSNYSVLLSSIDLNEEARIRFEYAQYQHREGGEVRDTRYPLVPITFTARVVGLGDTIDVRIEDLLEKCSDLMRAIYNSNGYLRYKPDGMGATVLDTYYRYIQSVLPRPLMGEKEYWARSRMTGGSTTYLEGIPSRQFEITLMTQPIAMSDPDNPYETMTASERYNIGDGDDHLTIAAAMVKGSVPATTRILAQPLTAGADAAIGTLWIAKRTSGLANFVSTYLTATHQAPVGVWSTVVDPDRCGNAYYRCTPAVSNAIYATRFTISDWAANKGRAAILIVARNNGTNADDFDIYYRWAIANYPLVGEKKQLSQIESWEPLLLGEIDLPETEMSSQEDLDLYIDICVVRTAGSGTLDIDGIKLFYTDEAAIQVDMPSGEGASTTHSFLLENFDEEIAHAVVHATDKLAYICNPYGDFLTLEPDVDNRIDVAWKRYILAALEIDFSEYGDNWQGIASMETSENWTGDISTISADQSVEGDACLHSTWDNNMSVSLVIDALDLSTFNFICLFGFLIRSGATYTLRLKTDSSNYYYYNYVAAGAGSEKHHFVIKVGDFSTTGSPSWGSINEIEFLAAIGAAVPEFYIDDLRASVADPDDANAYNETGDVWDFPSGEWHIYELEGATKYLGQIESGSGVEYVALVHTDYGADVKYRAKCRVRTTYGEAQRQAGLVFRATDGTSGSEDFYAFLFDPDFDELLLREYVAGVPSNVVAAVSRSLDIDTDYYLGVQTNGTSIKCYFSSILASLWDTSSKVFDTTDSTHTSGQCGLMTRTGLGRFTDVRLESLKDLHIPGDRIQLTAHSVFRTIYPFHEDAP